MLCLINLWFPAITTTVLCTKRTASSLLLFKVRKLNWKEVLFIILPCSRLINPSSWSVPDQLFLHHTASSPGRLKAGYQRNWRVRRHILASLPRRVPCPQRYTGQPFSNKTKKNVLVRCSCSVKVGLVLNGQWVDTTVIAQLKHFEESCLVECLDLIAPSSEN